MSDESYGAFAYAYDAALGERYFRSARRLLQRVLKTHAPPVRTHLDIACGTGLAIVDLQEQGFISTGVDRSLSMLQVAAVRTRRLIAGDLRALPLRATFGVITCLYDSLNHFRELRPIFREVRQRMTAQSIFIFDMNDPDVYPEIWGTKEPFIARGPGYHLEIATTFDRQSRTGHALVHGYATVDGARVDIREEHRQRAFARRDIERALASATLEPAEVIDFDPFGESRRVKLFYVCRAIA